MSVKQSGALFALMAAFSIQTASANSHGTETGNPAWIVEDGNEEYTVTPVRIYEDENGETRTETLTGADAGSSDGFVDVSADDQDPRRFLQLMLTFSAGNDGSVGNHGRIGLLIGWNGPWGKVECSDGSGGIMISVPMCIGAGILVELEAGQWGGSVSVGYGAAGGLGGGGEHGGFLIVPVLGVSAKIKLMRTWGTFDPERHHTSGETYIGPELTATIPVPIPLRISVGIMAKLSEGLGDGVYLYSGLGFGF